MKKNKQLGGSTPTNEPISNCKILGEIDLKPWERINENGQLEIDLVELEKHGLKMCITSFAIEEDEAEFTEEILPTTANGGKYIFGKHYKKNMQKH